MLQIYGKCQCIHINFMVYFNLLQVQNKAKNMQKI